MDEVEILHKDYDLLNIIKNKGTTILLTENMVDEFVEKYVPLAIEELQAVKKGMTYLKASDYAWERE